MHAVDAHLLARVRVEVDEEPLLPEAAGALVGEHLPPPERDEREMHALRAQFGREPPARLLPRERGHRIARAVRTKPVCAGVHADDAPLLFAHAHADEGGVQPHAVFFRNIGDGRHVPRLREPHGNELRIARRGEKFAREGVAVLQREVLLRAALVAVEEEQPAAVLGDLREELGAALVR